LSSIRVTYTGLISFIIGISSVITGFIFTLIITRKLTPDEFGTWSLIGVLVGYVLILYPIVNYWNTREIVRGVESGKTAFVTSNIFSVIGVLAYILIVNFYGTQTTVNKDILIIAALLIPVEFLRNVLNSITGGFKPQFVEYGFIAYESSKIPIAFILIYFLDMGLIGAIITTVLSSLVSIVILFSTSFEKIKGQFNSNYLKKWLKLFWIPTYPSISTTIIDTDIVIYSMITGSFTGVAYWSAVKAISRIVRHSIKMNSALYPKLLAGGKNEYLQENLLKVFYFAFPLSALSLAFAEPGLFALNPLYRIASSVMIFMVPIIFIRQLGNIFQVSLMGREKVDIKDESTFKDYIKSTLFYLPTLLIIQRVGYIASLSVLLFLLVPTKISEIELVTYWAIMLLIAEIPLTSYLYLLVRREFFPILDSKSILKYLLASILVFGLIYFLMKQYLLYTESIFEFLPSVLGFLALGISCYLGITYLIDSKTRLLFTGIMNEIKNKCM
jgi:O-antigen/teichoic acid export membrane protein